MDFAKKLALAILSPLFVVLLFVTAFDFGFVHTVTHPSTVKRLIAESGVYDSAVPSLLSQTKQISTSIGDISTANPLVEKAANTAVSPQYVRQNTEMTIDSIYAWLNGQTAQPDFNVNLNSAKADFAGNLANSVKKNLSSLPACTTATEINTFNALSATCLPPGTSPAEAAAQVKTAVQNGQGFLDSGNLSAADLKNGNSNQSVFADQLKNAPKAYQKAKHTPTVLIILAILAATGIVFLSRTRQKGLRHVGIDLVVIGVLMLVFSWALNHAVSTKVVPKIDPSNAVLRQDLRNLALDLTQQVDKNYWYFGGVYAVVGVAAIAATEVFRRRQQAATVEANRASRLS
ncbi:MAG TPA: hypothetical protein VHD84_00915 [Candidatus Saccharimonadales bacterium]|nr:hypothetical protein [Candidatus Saccharimonadales bacterium]